MIQRKEKGDLLPHLFPLVDGKLPYNYGFGGRQEKGSSTSATARTGSANERETKKNSKEQTTDRGEKKSYYSSHEFPGLKATLQTALISF